MVMRYTDPYTQDLSDHYNLSSVLTAIKMKSVLLCHTCGIRIICDKIWLYKGWHLNSSTSMHITIGVTIICFYYILCINVFYLRQNRLLLHVTVTPLSAHSSAKASTASHLVRSRLAPSCEQTSMRQDSKNSLEISGNLVIHSANGPDLLFIRPQYLSVATIEFILLLHVNVFGSSKVLHLLFWMKK